MYAVSMSDEYPKVSDEIVSRAISDYVELAQVGRGTGPEDQWMVFPWHGGEPTLAGIDFFDRVLQLQKRTGRSDFIINSLTSNGTLIDQDWPDFLIGGINSEYA
jgi:uncharacterized protein